MFAHLRSIVGVSRRYEVAATGFVDVGSGSGTVLDSQAERCRLAAETPVKSTRCEGNAEANDSSWRASVTVHHGSAIKHYHGRP
jgi:hypothetical protein